MTGKFAAFIKSCQKVLKPIETYRFALLSLIFGIQFWYLDQVGFLKNN